MGPTAASNTFAKRSRPATCLQADLTDFPEILLRETAPSMTETH